MNASEILQLFGMAAVAVTAIAAVGWLYGSLMRFLDPYPKTDNFLTNARLPNRPYPKGWRKIDIVP